ncbi:MAG: M10 family metallopeptidase C-terminal domain-containing protein, partial [Pseudomonadota bacterium]
VTGSGALGDFDLNQGIFTAMSYNDGYLTSPDGRPGTFDYGYNAGYGAIDIAALQELYGVNETHAAGGDIYQLATANGPDTGWEAIWDTGGIDWIVAQGPEDAVIDLRPATLTVAVGGGGFVSSVDGIHGGFTIAAGVLIERAHGGAGDDVLTGNEADNLLIGGAGADTLTGGAGQDGVSYQHSKAAVEVSLETGLGIGGDAKGDRLSEIEWLRGSRFTDTLTGDGEDNRLLGMHGQDQLEGGGGADVLLGGTGGDTLAGGAGNDRLKGEAGMDLLRGEDGSDVLEGGRSRDTLLGGAGEDVLRGGIGIDRLEGGDDADRLDGGENGDMLFGGDGADILVGGQGHDRLTGGSGDDRLIGGTGLDTYVFDTPGFGDDRITGFVYREVLDFTGLGLGLDDLEITQIAAGVQIETAQGSVLLEGKRIEGLTDANFLV